MRAVDTRAHEQGYRRACIWRVQPFVLGASVLEPQDSELAGGMSEREHLSPSSSSSLLSWFDSSSESNLPLSNFCLRHHHLCAVLSPLGDPRIIIAPLTTDAEAHIEDVDSISYYREAALQQQLEVDSPPTAIAGLCLPRKQQTTGGSCDRGAGTHRGTKGLVSKRRRRPPGWRVRSEHKPAAAHAQS